MYYLLKRKALDFQISAVAAEGPHACCWRQHSVAGARPAELLHARGLPPLGIQLPITASGVNLAERPVFLRTVTAAPRCQPTPASLAVPPRDATPAKQQHSTLGQRLATPPRLLEQPSKRSRLAPEAGAAAPHAGHLIAHCDSEHPIVLEMVPSSRPASCGSPPRSGRSSGGSSPSWLRRLSAGVSRLLTPSS